VYVFNNTVLAAGEGIVIRNREHPAWPQAVFANMVFAGAPLAGGQAIGNLLGSHDEAARYLRAPFRPLDEIDPSPLRVMRYQAVQPWPALGFPPTGLDDDPLVSGEIGAISSTARRRATWPRTLP
jgi:hypothetical protein